MLAACDLARAEHRAAETGAQCLGTAAEAHRISKAGAPSAGQVRNTSCSVRARAQESVFADEAAGATLGRLAQLGVHLALDDFGTGYSSLSYLRQYPIGTVKIDRTFLEEVPQNAASSTLVETIIVMAHALGKRVVAEGIETVEQLDFLRERRCDIAQGFFLARPLSGQAVTELLQGRTMSADSGISDIRAAG